MNSPTTRVLALLELLQSHGQLSGRELAERLEVDGRTLRRYIRHLEDLGIPVTSERGRHGGYRLVAGFKLPPLMFTAEEAQAVALGLLATANLGLAETAMAVASARAKLERVMPKGLQQRVRALSQSAILDLPRSRANGDQQLLAELAAAAEARRQVRVSYCSDQGQCSEREVDPYGLVFRQGFWYMSGYCHLRQAVRSFRLDRLREVRTLESHFERPEAFDAAAHLNTSIATLPRAYPVSIQLHTDLASAIAELGSDAGLLMPEGNSVRLTTSTDSPTWFARLLLRLSFDFTIEQPVELREAVRQQAQRMLELVAR
ncbi:Predicted DNA-binding transcriptional regulator YafY, contains an HTH and WYL domains [Pseudomonas sp. NFACC19-2]|uniref:helix-turn-helix transcriptional regulator n=1 Tax=Ectopseudomonas toyotomiensis TaxID=554344 RepID=UPI000908A395|nr:MULTISPECIES: YafY family protein [unclassified Pseudomonas]AQZ34582.1 transcriptional regulator [Pseudomonas sp. LPH1]SFW15169.1 Predicted DNA-binding transcriptional regulator YafY, contains an HTH and WYL domains [Pseudomonas sp. NFACC19-2]